MRGGGAGFARGRRGQAARFNDRPALKAASSRSGGLGACWQVGSERFPADGGDQHQLVATLFGDGDHGAGGARLEHQEQEQDHKTQISHAAKITKSARSTKLAKLATLAQLAKIVKLAN